MNQNSHFSARYFLAGLVLLSLSFFSFLPGTADAKQQDRTSGHDARNTVYVSELPMLEPSLGPLPVERKTVSMKGISYDKSLVVKSPSTIIYVLDRQYSSLHANLGLEDGTGENGSVEFQVFADGVQIYNSGMMDGSAWTKQILLSVLGVNELKLVVTDGGDGTASDFAVWANAKLERRLSSSPRMTAPTHRHTSDQEEPDHVFNDLLMAEKAKNYPAFVPPENEFRTEAGENLSGKWDAKVTWPFAFASAASLPDGRILAWGGNNPTSFNGGAFTYAAIRNPANNSITQINNNYHSMFCGIPVMLEDGRVFINGGDNGNGALNYQTSTFDFKTGAWTKIDNMKRNRWYPGSVALPDGKVFTGLGEAGDVYPEIWTPGLGWSLMTGINFTTPILNFTGYQKNWLPYFHLAPNGLIFHSGPTQQMNWINTSSSGSIADAGVANGWYPKYSASVMFEEGKILTTGGQADGVNLASTNQAMVLNLNGATATKTVITPMANARKFHNEIILPTGEVLVIGGSTQGVEFSDGGSVLAPELWNPTTQTWRTLASMSVPRNYHSVALLMPDGRVWSGGGGLCACAADHPDHQVFNPPYLYNADGTLATRPAISSVASVTRAGATLAVQATAAMQKFTLVKMSGITHNLNSDLRFLNVPFSETTAGNYQLQLKNNVNVLTPGYWMLFAVNSLGVPSVSKIIQVTNQGVPVITNPGNKTNFVGDIINLPIIAGDPNSDPLTYSATGLPAGLTINSTTGVITGTFGAGGTSTVTVSVSDGLATTSTTFNWLVSTRGTIRYAKLESLSEVNGNPWASAAEVKILDSNGVALTRTGWTATADSQETVGEPGQASNALDSNTNTIWHTAWSASSPVHPHWIVLDMKTNFSVGGFKYLPRQDGGVNGRIADYKFYVSADGINWGSPVAQGRFANDETEKTINILANRNPVFGALANRTNGIGEASNVTISATDADGDVLTYAASGLPAGLVMNSATGAITGTFTTAGTLNVTVTANDTRGGSVTGNFVWTVTPPALSINPIVSSPKLVNTVISYTATVTNGVNPRFKWLFGDGTAETAYSASATISRSFAQAGIYVVKVTAIDDRGVEKSTTFSQAIHLATTTNRPAVSMNIATENRATGNPRLWVVNEDNDSVSVFDAVTFTKAAEIAVGKAPRSVAMAPNGRVWISNKADATISIIDPATLGIVQTIALPYASQPFGIAFAPNGGGAFVALEAAGKISKFDAANGSILGSVNVGQNIRHLSISADGANVYASRFISPKVPGEETAVPQVANGGGEIVLINASALTVTQTIRLLHSNLPDTENSGRGIPNYLGPAVISPDGLNAWTPSKQDNVLRGTFREARNLTFDSTVRSVSSLINLATNTEELTARIDHNNGGIASTAAFDLKGNYLFVALEGTREIAVMNAYGKQEMFRINVGRAPQGLALSADGTKLFVSNFMDRSVTVLDISKVVNEGALTAPTLATLASVGVEKLTAQVLRGKQFFYDAKDTRLARDGYISCASCHNDGGHDGRVWDLTGFGEGLRNTISLQGRSGAQGLLHWSGNFDEVHDFEGQIRNLSGGTGLMTDAQFNTGTRNQPLGDRKAGVSADFDALVAYVASLSKFAPSPYRTSATALSVDAQAGQQIFKTANCASCHAATDFTNSTLGAPLQNIGTIKPASGMRLFAALTGIDTPTLRDVWATAPYLHDGSAATLEDAVRAHNGVTLAATDLTKLVSYLREIGSEEISAPSSTPQTWRYVKVEGLSEINGNPWASAAEINVLDGSGNALSRTGWTVTTDSQETAGEPGQASNVIDGNNGTIWHTAWSASSPNYPHWIVLDMKTNLTVKGLRYLPRQNGNLNGTIADYKIYVSLDGISWGTPVAQGKWASNNTEKIVTIP